MEQQFVNVFTTVYGRELRDYVDQQIATHYAELLLALSRIIVDNNMETVVRITAACHLGRAVDMKEPYPMDLNESPWLQMHVDTRQEIMANCCDALAALCTSDEDRRSVVDCVVHVASVEIATCSGSQILNAMLANMVPGASNEVQQRASLEVLTSIITRVKVVPAELTPLLLGTLERYAESNGKYVRNLYKSVIVCLGVLLKTCEDPVRPCVLQWIEHTNWSKRDTAVNALGLILEGPSPDSLSPAFTQFMPAIIKLLADPEDVVRDTAAWTVGRVCEVLPEVPLGDACLPKLVDTMVAALSSKRAVATTVRQVFSSLAQAAFQRSDILEDGTAETYELSQFFFIITWELICISLLGDTLSDLRTAAADAFLEMVRSAPRDCYVCIQRNTVRVLERLQEMVRLGKLQQSTQHKACVCRVLQAVLQKNYVYHKPLYMGIAYNIMPTILTIFEVNDDLNDNTAATNVWSSAVDILDDLARLVAPELEMYLPEVFENLFSTLGNPDTGRTIFSKILSTFSVLPLYLGASIAPYREQMMQVMTVACQDEVDIDNDQDIDDEDIDYLNRLRQSCIEAIDALIMGAAAQDDIQKFQFLNLHWRFIFKFIGRVGSKQNTNDDLIRECCKLVGDIATKVGALMRRLLKRKSISTLLERGCDSRNPRTEECAVWAIEKIGGVN